LTLTNQKSSDGGPFEKINLAKHIWKNLNGISGDKSPRDMQIDNLLYDENN